MRSHHSVVSVLLAACLWSLPARAVEEPWRAALAAAPLGGEEEKTLLAAYEERGGLLWLQDEGPTGQALALAALVAHADEMGLSADDYGGAELEAQLARAAVMGPEDRAALDVAISGAALLFVSDLVNGRVDPRTVHWRLGFRRPTPPIAQLLGSLAGTRDVGAWLDAVEAPSASYRRTSLALRRYLDLETRGDGPPLPAWKRTIAAGDSPLGLPALAARLQLLGDLGEGDAVYPAYQGALVLAVQRFQLRHGLTADGRLDRRTARALSVPISVRVRQLVLSLEHQRWLPRDLAPPLIVVNIPEFGLRALSPPGEPSLAMKVVVGRALRHHTPVFISALRAVEFHPFWNVPADIARGEVLPKLVGAPRRAVTQGFELVDAHQQKAAGPMDDLAQLGLDFGTLRLRQRAGPLNALGPLKMEMPNPYQVYLHGTASPDRFERTRRDFNHGCIRLQDPAALASWVLGHTSGWNEERVRAALAGESYVRAPLLKPIRVLILYSTAVVAEDGGVSFFNDLYGSDAVLEKALGRVSAARHRRSTLTTRPAGGAHTLIAKRPAFEPL